MSSNDRVPYRQMNELLGFVVVDLFLDFQLERHAVTLTSPKPSVYQLHPDLHTTVDGTCVATKYGNKGSAFVP